MSSSNKNNPTVSLFLPSLRGGGAERVMVNLARGFAEQGLSVDLVLAKAEGPFLSQVPKGVRVLDLGARRVLLALPGLVRYLRRERPRAMLSALSHANVVAIWARLMARTGTRLVVSEHSTLSQSTMNAAVRREKAIPFLIRRFYPLADTVVAVSQGAAEDLILQTGLPAEKVRVIYNPVVTPDLFAKADEPLDHPWFRSGESPVILGIGRLTTPKDFPTLIRAFALVRKKRQARLMILGEGEERPKLEALVRELGVEEDVALPGFVENPYSYMKRAGVFVLSSRWEGFGNVLVEALVLGTPVVSTDCPHGPREILEDGKWGQLVPVGDVEALAQAIVVGLDEERSRSMARAKIFALEEIVKQYAEVLGIAITKLGLN
ncbi:glycosyltransferase [Hydrogenibacillus sp. N12]|uniref:glycosyltransferase n=1 Tax=Hydrogenibacillus sp. N12 TaxID=2866627 RepID=UPI001C7D6619|nr:glycosyltransferase [Hydrogenibacillus sp. N12]QZA32873.1 glycosyltransferase [Hydrogenibacillus sp. N12]